MNFLLDFSISCPPEEGSDRAALVCTWHPARVNPPQLEIKSRGRTEFSENMSQVMLILVLIRDIKGLGMGILDTRHVRKKTS